jgi:hypothetical protein
MRGFIKIKSIGGRRGRSRKCVEIASKILKGV